MSAHNPNFNEEHIPLAYFISVRCYGTWLPGDARGWVSRKHNTYGTPYLPADETLEKDSFLKLKHTPVELDAWRRPIVEATIREVCQYRGWLLHAVHVRTNHFHTVVTAGCEPERVMHDFKAYATRRMKEARVWQDDYRPWVRHGSTRYIWTVQGIDRACDYVINGQGDDLVNFVIPDFDEDT